MPERRFVQLSVSVEMYFEVLAEFLRRTRAEQCIKSCADLSHYLTSVRIQTTYPSAENLLDQDRVCEVVSVHVQRVHVVLDIWVLTGLREKNGEMFLS